VAAAINCRAAACRDGRARGCWLQRRCGNTRATEHSDLSRLSATREGGWPPGRRGSRSRVRGGAVGRSVHERWAGIGQERTAGTGGREAAGCNAAAAILARPSTVTFPVSLQHGREGGRPVVAARDLVCDEGR